MRRSTASSRRPTIEPSAGETLENAGRSLRKKARVPPRPSRPTKNISKFFPTPRTPTKIKKRISELEEKTDAGIPKEQRISYSEHSVAQALACVSSVYDAYPTVFAKTAQAERLCYIRIFPRGWRKRLSRSTAAQRTCIEMLQKFPRARIMPEIAFPRREIQENAPATRTRRRATGCFTCSISWYRMNSTA